MAGSGTGAGNIQDEPGTSYATKKSNYQRKITRMGECQRDIEAKWKWLQWPKPEIIYATKPVDQKLTTVTQTFFYVFMERHPWKNTGIKQK